MARIKYVDPSNGGSLETEAGGLRGRDLFYPFAFEDTTIPDFSETKVGEGRAASLEMYDHLTSLAIYRNFLDWMFATFRTDEAVFRREMVSRLRPPVGGCVLITGCGLGDDIPAMLDAVGATGEVYAQDLSPVMVRSAKAMLERTCPAQASQVSFSAGDAGRLPFEDNSFDAAFHFGGINLFDDPAAGVAEMTRVVKVGGRVLVSDEGVAPWLRDTDYGKMVVTNNHLWAHRPLIEALPPNAADVALSWVLANCFWTITYEVGAGLPDIDPTIVHKGRRGGSMLTRHTGQLEAVTCETRRSVEAAAARAGVSVHDWMEKALGAALRESP